MRCHKTCTSFLGRIKLGVTTSITRGAVTSRLPQQKLAGRNERRGMREGVQDFSSLKIMMEKRTIVLRIQGFYPNPTPSSAEVP